MRNAFLLNIAILVVCLSCCQNGSGCRINSDDIDSVCIDYWRWDKGHRYHVVLDKNKGYISRCVIDGDSVTIPLELPSDDVDKIIVYVTKVYIEKCDTPPYVKKQAERMLYRMPERMVTTISAEGHCIADTFHYPTITEYKYVYSDHFKKLLNILSELTDNY